MIESGPGVLETSRAERRSRFGDFFEMTKPRLTLLSVLTTLAGFYVAADNGIDFMLLTHTLLGTFMVGGGCGVLNMYVEREHDAKMRRTMTRPIPAGKISAREALLFGVLLSVGGLLYLSLAVNLLAGALAAATLLSYVFLYTPLKRRSTLNTIVGAVPGALPPVIGWAAVRNDISAEAWILFGIMFLWQIPHFLALAWMYRRDYERAGYRMLPVIDPSGVRTSRQILLYAAALLPMSLLLALIGTTGALYFIGAAFLGISFIVFGWVLAASKKNVHAKWVFYYSLLYLPFLFLVLALDLP